MNILNNRFLKKGYLHQQWHHPEFKVNGPFLLRLTGYLGAGGVSAELGAVALDLSVEDVLRGDLLLQVCHGGPVLLRVHLPLTNTHTRTTLARDGPQRFPAMGGVQVKRTGLCFCNDKEEPQHLTSSNRSVPVK